MQMIAEKSVNCSLLSLPSSPGKNVVFLLQILREELIFLLGKQIISELILNTHNT